jgi:hypothetical protein
MPALRRAGACDREPSMPQFLDGRALGRLARIVRRLIRTDESDRRSGPSAGTPPKAPRERPGATVVRLSGAPFRVWRSGVRWAWETDAKVGGDRGAALSLKGARRAARAAIRRHKARHDSPAAGADQGTEG